MVAPDLLTSVGFHRRKLGAGGKQLGYAIEGGRLRAFLLAAALLLFALGSLLTWSRFEIHIERRSHRREHRAEEHSAAARLAQVEMELWSEYREDILESREARELLRSFNASFDELRADLRSSIERTARVSGLDPPKALSLADAALETLADHRRASVEQVKVLVDHLVALGRRSGAAKLHLDEEIMNEMRAESAHIAEDGLEWEGGEMSPEEIKLNALVGGFLETYRSYTQEFAGATAALREGDAVYQQLQDLRERVSGEDPIREDEAHARLQAIGRQGLEPHFKKGTSIFMRSILDYLDVLLATPRVPHGELAEFEREWQRAERDPYSLLMQVHSWQDEGKIPGLWLEHAMKLYDDALARH